MDKDNTDATGNILQCEFDGVASNVSVTSVSGLEGDINPFTVARSRSNSSIGTARYSHVSRCAAHTSD